MVDISIYPMHTQMQLLVDAEVAGAKRVFDVEWLAGDPLFTHLADGAVPSVAGLGEQPYPQTGRRLDIGEGQRRRWRHRRRGRRDLHTRVRGTMLAAPAPT